MKRLREEREHDRSRGLAERNGSHFIKHLTTSWMAKNELEMEARNKSRPKRPSRCQR